MLLLVVSIVAAVILQASVLPVHVTTFFKPDLLLVIMVFLALRGSYESGTPLAWLLGLLKDVFSGLYLGLNAFTFLIIFLFIKSIADRLYAESSFLFVVTVTAATVGCVAGNFLLLFLFANVPGIFFSMLIGLLPHLLVNAFAASLLTLLPSFSREVEVA